MIVSQKKKRISKSDEVAAILHALLNAEDEIDRDKEHFWVIGLNGQNVIQYIDLCSLGIVNRALVHPREIFRLAITKGITSILVAHNHPSDDVLPSEDDKEITKQLREAGKILGIKVLDHLIVASNCNTNYFSFNDQGL